MLLLSIYTKEAQKYAEQLQQMARSAFPVAIRQALSGAAFDVKKTTLQRSVDKHFTTRQKNFFKANSRVIPAQGFDIGKMQSEIGMIETGLKGNNFSVKDLQAQEKGGTIPRKSFIPLNTARTGKSLGKNVSPTNRLSGINRIVDARKAKGVNDRQKFVKSVAFAGRGGYVLAKWKDKMILWRVNSLNKTASGAFKLTPLYSYEPGRTVHVHATQFMREAAMESTKKIPDLFVTEAKKQVNKVIGKSVV